MKLNLRAHHLLCLNGFQGYGYNENFTQNMIKINSDRQKSDTIISITNKPDDICKQCPNLKNNICENKKQNERIISMDNAVLEKIDNKTDYLSIELFKKINEVFNTKTSVKHICVKCMWQDKCLFYQKLLNNR